MEQVIVKLKDSSKRNVLLALLQQLDFVEISIPKVRKKSKAQQEFIEGMKDALNDVELHLQGKKQLQSAKDFLNEL
jgi:hypothetical protein